MVEMLKLFKEENNNVTLSDNTSCELLESTGMWCSGYILGLMQFEKTVELPRKYADNYRYFLQADDNNHVHIKRIKK